GEDFHVLRHRLASGARGAAEDRRRAHAEVEDAVVRGVALEIRTLHFGNSWQRIHDASLPILRGASPPIFRRRCRFRQAPSSYSSISAWAPDASVTISTEPVRPASSPVPDPGTM